MTLKTIISVFNSALIALSFLFLYMGFTSAQSFPVDKNLSLKASIKEPVCTGKTFEIEVSICNKSKVVIWIDKSKLWRYSNEEALDELTGSNIPLLRLPKMRSVREDSFILDGSEREYFMRLAPNKSFTDSFTIDPKTDDFYANPGRYSIILGYGQFQKRLKGGIKPFVGAIYSDKLNFEIKQCE